MEINCTNLFIIDILSIRGSNAEATQLQVQDELGAIADNKQNDVCLMIQIITAMIKKILHKLECQSQIILFSRNHCRYSENVRIVAAQSTFNQNVQVMIGQQALFYFLGRKADKISCVMCISKESMFFSKDLLDLIKNRRDNLECEVFSLSRFGEAIK